MNVGIDAVAFDLPKIHLPIKTLADARNIEAEKLEKGLGLIHMTLPDQHQDTVVFGANALRKLISDHSLHLKDIGRIYVGTESGIDNSKPIGSFLLALMEQQYGQNSLEHCDVTDFTFACIGAVDALQNCIDYIRLNPEQKAIVIASDIAKYDLGSTGEYTQGAGAIAMLVSSNPKILAFENKWATSTQGVFDFFKPYRHLSKAEILGTTENQPWFGQLENQIEIHKDQPVFDGHYSNQCYMARTKSAYFSFKKINEINSILFEDWENICLHLPYAFQGRRMFSAIFGLEYELLPDESNPDYPEKLRSVGKSEAYQNLVQQKIKPSELASSKIGNLYTGSIFMGLLSALCNAHRSGKELAGKKIGFLAYGSGSKSKVFEGIVQSDWKQSIALVDLFETIEKSTAIDFETYERLHKKELQTSILLPKSEWILERIEDQQPNLMGARYYQWIA